MKLSLTILTILLTILQSGWTQTKFNFGPELGLSFSHIPTKDERTNRTDLITTKTKPLMSPLVGFYGQLTIKKHIQFTVGLQYQKTGTRYHLHKVGRVPRDASIPAFFYYTQDEWENQTFHKLCLPLTAGYSFKIGKTIQSIFIGFRPNLFLAGNYNNKMVFDATVNSEDYENENEYVPVNPDEAAVPVDRYKTQYLIGLSTFIGQHIKISLVYNQGYRFYYSEYEQIGCIVDYTYFRNSDFGLSMTYLLKPPRKKTKPTEKKE